MDARIRKVIAFIESDLTANPSLKELAEIACLSTSQLHRRFKKEVGKTPFQFVEEIKINRAYEQLVKGKPKVCDLAYELGYNDYETFSRAFKKHHHISPDDLRAIALKVARKANVKDDGKVIVKAVESADNILEVLQNLEITSFSESDLQQAVLYKVSLKSDGAVTEDVIKNKYEIVIDNNLLMNTLKEWKR